MLETFAPTRVIELQSYGSQFSMCTSLTSVDVEIRAKSGTTYVPGNCFSGCSALASVRLLSTATTISFATRSFGSCTALEELVLDFGRSRFDLAEHELAGAFEVVDAIVAALDYRHVLYLKVGRHEDGSRCYRNADEIDERRFDYALLIIGLVFFIFTVHEYSISKKSSL
jgi:hypothetical protein